MKLHPPNAAAYWSCRPPSSAAVLALDLEGQLRDVVFAERAAFSHSTHRLQPWPRPAWTRRRGRSRRARRSWSTPGPRGRAAVELADDAVLDRLLEDETVPPAEYAGALAALNCSRASRSAKLPRGRWPAARGGSRHTCHRGVEHVAAVAVAERRDVGGPAGEGRGAGGRGSG